MEALYSVSYTIKFALKREIGYGHVAFQRMKLALTVTGKIWLQVRTYENGLIMILINGPTSERSI